MNTVTHADLGNGDIESTLTLGHHHRPGVSVTPPPVRFWTPVIRVTGSVTGLRRPPLRVHFLERFIQLYRLPRSFPLPEIPRDRPPLVNGTNYNLQDIDHRDDRLRALAILERKGH